jgi:hypothetical protein
VADLEAGRPLRAVACGGRVAMRAGIQEVDSLARPLVIDLVRLASPAPAPTAIAGGGRVVRAGHIGDNSVDGTRVALDGRSWLVLGESFSRGWRASCDGRSLGEPRPMNGYANGWLAPADCRNVSFSYAPQSIVRAGQLISLVVCLALLAFLLVARRAVLRRRPVAAAETLPDDLHARMPLPRAAVLAFVGTLPLSFLFAGRASLAIFPGLTLILWLGIGTRLLTWAAAALIGIVIPLLYVIESPRNRGGYNFEYSLDIIWAHWVGVAALILLIVACWRMLAATGAGRPAAGSPPAGERSAEPGDKPRDLAELGSAR